MPFNFTIARLWENIERINTATAVRSIIDILIIAYVIYKLLVIIRGTKAVSLIKGIAVIFITTMLSDLLEFRTVNWLLQKTITMLFVALPIVFLPELRRALEQIGRGGIFTSGLSGLLEKEEIQKLISNLCKAIKILSQDKIGALIVIERDTGVAELMETGVQIGAVVSAELLLNIFMPNSPLHDGAVIIRGNTIMAAGCYLPLSENPNISKRLGTRHRAALGLSEQSDAISIVVSEETGVISIAANGKLMRYLDESALYEKLIELLYGGNFKHGIPSWLRGHVL